MNQTVIKHPAASRAGIGLQARLQANRDAGCSVGAFVGRVSTRQQRRNKHCVGLKSDLQAIAIKCRVGKHYPPNPHSPAWAASCPPYSAASRSAIGLQARLQANRGAGCSPAGLLAVVGRTSVRQQRQYQHRVGLKSDLQTIHPSPTQQGRRKANHV
ncbi:MAG: hypothetical protein QG667_1696 [Pseudomonadota bacterium]|nr:hypothetical protein [Pseudomonadota bacterium]